MRLVYREQYLLQKAYSNRKVFKYFVGSPKISAYNDQKFWCPICDAVNDTDFLSTSGNPDIIKCYPSKRVVISGFLFWKKRCPIDGYHTHYRCKICKMHTIVHNEKANSLIFSETPIIGPDLSHVQLKLP